MWHAWGGERFYRFLVGRPEGKRTLERPRRRWKINIHMDPREIGIRGPNWIQWRNIVRTIKKLRVP
jgi:hypothetical protein